MAVYKTEINKLVSVLGFRININFEVPGVFDLQKNPIKYV